MASWPRTAGELIRVQEELGAARPSLWRPAGRPRIGGCFVCFEQEAAGPGAARDPGWAGAVLGDASAVVTGEASTGYEAGLLALREGPLLEAAVRGLPQLPDLLLANATGRDHPRRGGLALHLGAVLGVPTVGVTHRCLHAAGDWPGDERGATSPLLLDDEVVGYWLRTRRGTRPLAVHAAWRTGPDTAVEIVLAATERARTPEPLRLARTAGRRARAAVTGARM